MGRREGRDCPADRRGLVLGEEVPPPAHVDQRRVRELPPDPPRPRGTDQHAGSREQQLGLTGRDDLQRVLPGYEAAPFEVFAVFAAKQRRSPRIRAVLGVLERVLPEDVAGSANAGQVA